MRFFTTCWACSTAVLILSGSVFAASEEKSKAKPLKPCTIRSATSGSFFDINGLKIVPPIKDPKSKKETKPESWHVRGYDYGANFTLNFCGPVVEDIDEFEGVSDKLARNVSAFYTIGKRSYSLGTLNTELVLRGRKLVLNYTGGSPCEDGHPSTHRTRSNQVQPLRRKTYDDDDDDDEKPKHPTKRRKSTIISLLCEKDPLPPKAPNAIVSFVGASDDHCTYFFEARSPIACAGAETSTSGQLSPGGVFGVIMLIAMLVYFVGGCVYQRTVLRQRGWRQIPNYSMWAGCFGFFVDWFVILTSSCARFFPGRSGYSRVSLGNGSTNGRSRDHRSDDENRLIDNLDEEWDD